MNGKVKIPKMIIEDTNHNKIIKFDTSRSGSVYIKIWTEKGFSSFDMYYDNDYIERTKAFFDQFPLEPEEE